MKRRPPLRVVGGTQKQQVRMEKAYLKQLHSIVDDIFNTATHNLDWTWTRLANEAHVSVVTVFNLGERITKFPRFRTVLALAQAVGMDLQIVNVASNKKKQKVG